MKSGTDFRSFSKISVSFDKNSNRISAETKKIVIDSSIEVDKEIDKVTKDFFGNYLLSYCYLFITNGILDASIGRKVTFRSKREE